MFVVTMDQKDSRHDADRVPDLLSRLDPIETLGGFARTVGDEVQGALASADQVVRAARIGLWSGYWHIGIGCGSAGSGDIFADDDAMRSARSPAFIRAREAVEASKKYTVSLAVVGADVDLAGDVQAVLQLLGVLIDSRTDAQREVVELAGEGLSGQEIAKRLGISEASVSRRRGLSRISEEEAAWPAIRRLLAELDASNGGVS